MARRPARQRAPLGIPALEVCVHGQPVSAQTANRRALRAWKGRVRAACEAAWGVGQLPIEGGVTIRVTHYFEVSIGDVDNLLKPIQDALQGVAYVNDKQVTDVIANRRNIKGLLECVIFQSGSRLQLTPMEATRSYPSLGGVRNMRSWDDGHTV